MTKAPEFSSFDSLPVPEGREAYLQDVWLKSRLFFLRMTHPVDDVVALMEEFETGVALRHDKWKQSQYTEIKINWIDNDQLHR